MKACITCGKTFNRPQKDGRKKCFDCSPAYRKNTELWGKIVQLRDDGYTQLKISETLNISKSVVSYWCSNLRSTSLSNKCPICGNQHNKRSAKCINCTSIDIPIKDLMYKIGEKANTYTKIRSRARNVAEKFGLALNGCSKCGYKKHVEICHIKPISSFNESTLISVVNDKDNLIALCPNCHWEFDHPESAEIRS